MPAVSAKNYPLSPAGADLGLNADGFGLGDSLTEQLDEQETERKKKLLGQKQATLNTSTAAMMLLGGGLGG